MVIGTRFVRLMTITGLTLSTASSAGAQDTRQNAEILRRIAALEAQIAELKAMVEQQPATAALQEVTDDEKKYLDYMHDLKFGAALDTYYSHNFNRPIGRVNLLRAYDVTSNNFSLN